MLLKQLDNWVRRAVYETRVEKRERRSGQERRQQKDRRRESRSGIEAEGRRSVSDRRREQRQGNNSAINNRQGFVPPDS